MLVKADRSARETLNLTFDLLTPTMMMRRSQTAAIWRLSQACVVRCRAYNATSGVELQSLTALQLRPVRHRLWRVEASSRNWLASSKRERNSVARSAASRQFCTSKQLTLTVDLTRQTGPRWDTSRCRSPARISVGFRSSTRGGDRARQTTAHA